MRRADARYRSGGPGVDSRHSFSFGAHYDPANVGFGPLIAHSEERVRPGAGFPNHRHAAVEIVTWVLAGALVHTDSLGRASVLRPGDLRVQSAGSGMVHAETGHPDEDETRFVQAWLRPDEPGGEPTAELAHLGPARGGLVLAASGGADAPTRLRCASATLWLVRPGHGQRVVLPRSPLQHLFVAGGRVRLPTDPTLLDVGDCLRLVDEPGLSLVVASGAELLIWAFD